MQITIDEKDPIFPKVMALVGGVEPEVEDEEEEQVDAYTNMNKPTLKKTIRSKGIMSRVPTNLDENELREILRAHEASTADDEDEEEEEEEEDPKPRKRKTRKKREEPEEDEDEDEDEDEEDDEDEDDDDDEDEDDEDGVELEIGMKINATIRGQTHKNCKVKQIKDTGKVQVFSPKTKKNHWVSGEDCYV